MFVNDNFSRHCSKFKYLSDNDDNKLQNLKGKKEGNQDSFLWCVSKFQKSQFLTERDFFVE